MHIRHAYNVLISYAQRFAYDSRRVFSTGPDLHVGFSSPYDATVVNYSNLRSANYRENELRRV